MGIDSSNDCLHRWGSGWGVLGVFIVTPCNAFDDKLLLICLLSSFNIILSIHVLFNCLFLFNSISLSFLQPSTAVMY